MKKLAACLCFLFFACALNAYAEEIKVAYFDFPPLVVSAGEGQKPTGSMIDYYEELAKDMGVTVRWVGPLPAPRAIRMVEENEVDAVVFLTKNAEREKISAYPSLPVYTMIPVVCLKKSDPLDKVETWDDLKSKSKVGTIYGTSFEKEVAKACPDLKLARLRMEGDMIAYAMSLMQKNRMDAFLWADKYMVDIALDKLNLTSDIKVLSAPMPERPLYNVFSLKRPDLLEKYNKSFGHIKYGKTL